MCFVLLSIRNGTFLEFHCKYSAIMPLLLCLCALISLQIFWRAYNRSVFEFQIVSNPSHLYRECTFWYWLCKAVLLWFESLSCLYYYLQRTYDGERLMECTLRLHHSCATFANLMCLHLTLTYFEILNNAKETEQCWQTVFLLEALWKFMLPLWWNIYDCAYDVKPLKQD